MAGKLAADFFSRSTRTSNRRFKRDFDWQPRYPTYREGLDQIVQAWHAEASPALPSASSLRIVIDDQGTRCEYPDGNVEAVRWDEMRKVAIITTDEGPFVEDVYFALFGTNGGCAVPSSAPESQALLERLQQLPGFNNQAVTDAMCCADNQEFVCWERA